MPVHGFRAHYVPGPKAKEARNFAVRTEAEREGQPGTVPPGRPERTGRPGSPKLRPTFNSGSTAAPEVRRTLKGLGAAPA